MTLEAIREDNTELLFQAFIEDPLVNIQRDKAKKLFDRMLIESAVRY